MNEQEKLALSLKKMADAALNDAKSIYAPCKNAYMEKGRDGHTLCSCWRCRKKDNSPGRGDTW